MRKANWSDKDKVVSIITQCFDDNPALRWMLKGGSRFPGSLQRLAWYAFVKCMVHGQVLLSDNEKGVALYYRANSRVFSLREIVARVWFGFSSMPLLRIRKVLRREAHRQSFRPASGNYLYFWFLGVLPEGRGAGFELKEALFAEALRLHLPIYLETSLERNRIVYERIGFTTYHEWKDEAANIHFWFMKWEP